MTDMEKFKTYFDAQSALSSTLLNKSVFGSGFKYATFGEKKTGQKWNDDTDAYEDYDYYVTQKAESSDDAELLISRVPGQKGMHYPILDLDSPHLYIPSTQSGHGHLVFTKPISDTLYWKLLTVMAECGIIEEGYASASKNKNFAAIRLPWVVKSKEEIEKSKAKENSVAPAPPSTPPPTPKTLGFPHLEDVFSAAALKKLSGPALVFSGTMWTSAKPLGYIVSNITVSKYKSGKIYSHNAVSSYYEPAVTLTLRMYGAEIVDPERFGVGGVPNYVYVPKGAGVSVWKSDTGHYVKTAETVIFWPVAASTSGGHSANYASCFPHAISGVPTLATKVYEEDAAPTPKPVEDSEEVKNVLKLLGKANFKTKYTSEIDSAVLKEHPSIQKYGIFEINPEQQPPIYWFTEDGVKYHSLSTESGSSSWYVGKYGVGLSSIVVAMSGSIVSNYYKPGAVSFAKSDLWESDYAKFKDSGVDKFNTFKDVPDAVLDQPEMDLTYPIFSKESVAGSTVYYFFSKKLGKYRAYIISPSFTSNLVSNAWTKDEVFKAVTGSAKSWTVYTPSPESFAKKSSYDVLEESDDLVGLYGSLKGSAKFIEFNENFTFSTLDPETGEFTQPTKDFPWVYLQNLGGSQKTVGDVTSVFAPSAFGEDDPEWFITKAQSLGSKSIYKSIGPSGPVYAITSTDPAITFFWDKYTEPVAEVYGGKPEFLKKCFKATSFKKSPVKKPVPKKILEAESITVSKIESSQPVDLKTYLKSLTNSKAAKYKIQSLSLANPNFDKLKGFLAVGVSNIEHTLPDTFESLYKIISFDPVKEHLTKGEKVIAGVRVKLTPTGASYADVYLTDKGDWVSLISGFGGMSGPYTHKVPPYTNEGGKFYKTVFFLSAEEDGSVSTKEPAPECPVTIEGVKVLPSTAAIPKALKEEAKEMHSVYKASSKNGMMYYMVSNSGKTYIKWGDDSLYMTISQSVLDDQFWDEQNVSVVYKLNV
jgi:hypothetical protein